MSTSSTMRQRVSRNAASPRDNNGDAGTFSQLDLFQLPADKDDQWELCKKLIAESVEEIGNKDACFEMGVTKHDLAHALAERERHHIRARWLLTLIRRAKSDDLLRFFAALRGLDVVAPEVLPPDIEVERRKAAAVKLFGPQGAALIDREVYGR